MIIIIIFKASFHKLNTTFTPTPLHPLSQHGLEFGSRPYNWKAKVVSL